MHLRLFEISEERNGYTLLLDVFPVRLGYDSQADELSVRDTDDVSDCVLEDDEGLIVFRCSNPAADLTVNDAPLEFGPLFPGDRLRMGKRRFIVSYESTGVPREMPVRFRLATTE